MQARGKLTAVEIAIAFVIGLGMILMMVAGGVGAALAEYANAQFVGIIVVLGVAVMVIGVVLWFAFVRPWTQFDDINVPKDTGHH